jgi:hypothetical protein
VGVEAMNKEQHNHQTGASASPLDEQRLQSKLGMLGFICVYIRRIVHARNGRLYRRYSIEIYHTILFYEISKLQN